LLIFCFRVNVQDEENKLEKKHFWQRFHAKKQEKTPTEAVSIRSLVKKFIAIVFLSYN
jgi:hypothetical protein